MRSRHRWLTALVVLALTAAGCASEQADTVVDAEAASEQATAQSEPNESEPGTAPTTTERLTADTITPEAAPKPEAQNAIATSTVTEAATASEFSSSVDQARTECESRNGHTELLLWGNQHICYEVTVLDDGWRLCDLSLPYLAVSAETLHQSEYPSCGNAGPRGAVEEAAVEEARRECEARNGHTEFLPVDDRYSCFEITVLDDGWRTCAWSVPYLTVITETTEPEYPCGTPGPEWPFFVDEAPAECGSAGDWYADYLESVIDEMNRVVALEETPDAASVQAWLSDLGHLFEQNGRRAEAAQASCATGDSLGIFIGIAEARDGLDEGYESVVVGCVTDGIHDCTALAPTAKAECETLDPEFVYLLDSWMLENGLLEGWPHVAASGCSLRGQ